MIHSQLYGILRKLGENLKVTLGQKKFFNDFTSRKDINREIETENTKIWRKLAISE